eukprot:5309464-Pyramimonas_sp.AAC.1
MGRAVESYNCEGGAAKAAAAEAGEAHGGRPQGKAPRRPAPNEPAPPTFDTSRARGRPEGGQDRERPTAGPGVFESGGHCWRGGPPNAPVPSGALLPGRARGQREGGRDSLDQSD